MLTKFVLAFGILAVAAASAGSIPTKSPIYKLTLTQPVVVAGTALKAGAYRVVVGEKTVTFTIDGESQTIPAKVEVNRTKYYSDEIQYDKDGNHVTISEIGVGGTKTRLLFQ
jgi:hypothetical protein